MEERTVMLASLLSIFVIVALVSWAVHPPVAASTGGVGLAVWKQTHVEPKNIPCIVEGVEQWLPKKKIFKICGSQTYVQLQKVDTGCLITVSDQSVGIETQHFPLLRPMYFGKYTYVITADSYGECKIRVTKHTT